MPDLAYSGQLVRARQSSHYSGHVPVAGVTADHIATGDNEQPDLFGPEPAAGPGAPGDVWQPADLPVHTEMQVQPVTHWTQLHAPVPTNVPSERAGIATTVRMLANHAAVAYRPDQYVPYRHTAQGRSIEYVDGRAPWVAGESVPEESAYLQAGTNAYDRQNEPNEVYSAGGSNVGRYRLGVRIEDNGLYEFHTKQGQDAEVRAYTGLTPMFPVEKERVPDSAPYTPNSSGMTTWTLDAFQRPSFFALPSETSMTDFEISETAEAGSDFNEGERL